VDERRSAARTSIFWNCSAARPASPARSRRAAEPEGQREVVGMPVRARSGRARSCGWAGPPRGAAARCGASTGSAGCGASAARSHTRRASRGSPAFRWAPAEQEGRGHGSAACGGRPEVRHRAREVAPLRALPPDPVVQLRPGSPPRRPAPRAAPRPGIWVWATRASAKRPRSIRASRAARAPRRAGSAQAERVSGRSRPAAPRPPPARGQEREVPQPSEQAPEHAPAPKTPPPDP
jgi:hypothetical protein